MSNTVLAGSCLCGSVSYRARKPFLEESRLARHGRDGAGGGRDAAGDPSRAAVTLAAPAALAPGGVEAETLPQIPVGEQ